MPRLLIDNRRVQVEDGATVLDAAEKLGIEIPTMCFLKGYKAATSCSPAKNIKDRPNKYRP